MDICSPPARWRQHICFRPFLDENANQVLPRLNTEYKSKAALFLRGKGWCSYINGYSLFALFVTLRKFLRDLGHFIPDIVQEHADSEEFVADHALCECNNGNGSAAANGS